MLRKKTGLSHEKFIQMVFQITLKPFFGGGVGRVRKNDVDNLLFQTKCNNFIADPVEMLKY